MSLYDHLSPRPRIALRYRTNAFAPRTRRILHDIRDSILSILKIITKDDHIADADAVLIARLAVVPEVVFADVIDAKPALLIKGDIPDAGVGGADQHLPLAASACLGQEPCDDRTANALPLAVGRDGQLDQLARVDTPLHRRRADQLIIV